MQRVSYWNLDSSTI